MSSLVKKNPNKQKKGINTHPLKKKKKVFHMTHSFSNFLPWETKKPKNVDGHTNNLPRKHLIRPALMPNQSNSDYYILVKANATSNSSMQTIQIPPAFRPMHKN